MSLKLLRALIAAPVRAPVCRVLAPVCRVRAPVCRVHARVLVMLVSVLGVLALVPFDARAQGDASGYPNKAIRINVGFTPGSATDISARIFAQKFSEAWGIAVTVENVPGAGGTVGAARVAKTPPDGYTLLYAANGAMTIAPSLQSKLAYDPTRDFAPISLVLTAPSIVAVNNELPVKSFQELIALVKAHPGKFSYATPGAGTPQHIAGELLKILGGLDITHVPYRGAVFTDVIGGRVAITLQNAGAILTSVRDGKLRGLAITALNRSPNIPEFPTISESGFPGFEAVSWFALLAPLGTPTALIGKVHQETVKVLAQPDMQARFSQLGLDPAGTSPNELAAIIKSDIEKWAKVIKDAGITASE
ncbi:MAG: Bug family tripartite tricarboxylate transporter substrate binding protein [Burkholderiales bacterium]